MKEPTARTRKIQSFVLRQGRLTKGQEHAITHYYDKHVLAFDKTSFLSMEEVFANQHKVTLEIGFGMGASLAEMAKVAPEQNFLGIEVHQPGVGALLGLIEREGLNNLKIIHHDAVEVLNHQVADESIDCFQIFFPDPWPKKRHHKRRLIQDSFIRLLLPKLKPGGRLHVATDWEDYATWSMTCLSTFKELENIAGPNQYCERPDHRPLTKFENRGKRLGHGVWDLIFQKT